MRSSSSCATRRLALMRPGTRPCGLSPTTRGGLMQQSWPLILVPGVVNAPTVLDTNTDAGFSHLVFVCNLSMAGSPDPVLRQTVPQLLT